MGGSISDFVFFNFRKPEFLWYEVMKMAVMFTPALLSCVCSCRVWMYKRSRLATNNQQNEQNLISQSQGLLVITSVFIISCLALCIVENIMPASYDNIHGSESVITWSIIYLYFILKLPIFLVVFKPFRQLARSMCCPCLQQNQVHPAAAGRQGSAGSSRRR